MSGQNNSTVWQKRYEKYKLGLWEVTIGRLIGGGLPAFYKGVGIGMTIISILEPILFRIGITIAAPYGIAATVASALVFGILMLAEHIYKTVRKYNKVREAQIDLGKLEPLSQINTWKERRVKLGVCYDYQADFYDKDPEITFDEAQRKHNNLLGRLQKALKIALADAASANPVISQNHRRSIELAKARYEAQSKLHSDRIDLHRQNAKIRQVPWLNDYRQRGDDLKNVMFGLLFGWSLYHFAFKILTVSAVSAIPGGLAAFMVLCVTVALIFQFIGHNFNDRFKEHSKKVKRDASISQLRREIVDFKFLQFETEKKLEKFDRARGASTSSYGQMQLQSIGPPAPGSIPIPAVPLSAGGQPPAGSNTGSTEAEITVLPPSPIGAPTVSQVQVQGDAAQAANLATVGLMPEPTYNLGLPGGPGNPQVPIEPAH